MFLCLSFLHQKLFISLDLVNIEKLFTVYHLLRQVFILLFYIIFFSNIEFYYERTKEIMYASIGAAVLNIVLNIGFIKAFGYTGAAYTTLICYMVLSLVHYCVMKDSIKKNIMKLNFLTKVVDLSFSNCVDLHWHIYNILSDYCTEI